MPETNTGKILALGNFSSTTTPLYTVPANTTTRVTHIHICSESAVGVDLSIEDVSQTPTATANLLKGYSLEANSVFDDFDFILEAGDIIRGHTPSVSNCDYIIFGIETTEVTP